MSNSGSNTKGAYQRALHRWRRAVVYVVGKMGRGGTRASQVAIVLADYASRKDFLEAGYLVSFPGLDFFALLADLNEKTIRRAVADLERAGLIVVKHRYDTSNLYYLTIPAAAETHLQHCDLVIQKRRLARRKRLSQVSSQGGQMGAGAGPKCPTNSDLNSDYNSPLKGRDLASRHTKKDQERGLGEEERIAASQCSPTSSSPEESVAFEMARKHYGDRGASLVALKLRDGVPADEILYELRECLENDNDPGHALWFPDYSGVL